VLPLILEQWGQGRVSDASGLKVPDLQSVNVVCADWLDQGKFR